MSLAVTSWLMDGLAAPGLAPGHTADMRSQAAPPIGAVAACDVASRPRAGHR
jgi:hypothetical protein